MWIIVFAEVPLTVEDAGEALLVPDPQYGAQWHYDGVVSGGIYPQNLTYGMNLPHHINAVQG